MTYYEAQISLTVRGEAANRESFLAETDRLIDECLLHTATIDTALDCDTAELDLVFAGGAN